MKMLRRCFTYLLSIAFAVVGYSQNGLGQFHVAEEGQTLYSIARMHAVDIHLVMDCNDALVTNGLSIGDTVLLNCETSDQAESFEGFHRVQQGETLYSICRMYGVSVEDVMLWNDMTTSSLSIDQLLKVAEANTQVTIEWTRTHKMDSAPNGLSEVSNSMLDSLSSYQEHLFHIAGLTGGEMTEGQDTFYIVDSLPEGFSLCSSSFNRDSSIYEPLGLIALHGEGDTVFEWVDLQGVCLSNRHEISHALADRLRQENVGSASPWLILSWRLTALKRTFSEE
ncbi:MAG: LysM peptidoglycan-binding domain-containing protein [Chitinophagales bacterium]